MTTNPKDEAGEVDPMDRTLFALDEQAWRRFEALLNRPARDLPGLAQLMEKGSILD